MAARRITPVRVPPVLSAAPLVRPFDYNAEDFQFPDFLVREGCYAAAQRYWHVVFDRARTAAPVPLEENWRPHWHFNPRKDGNPIFTTVCRPRQLAVRIIQLSPVDVTAGCGFSWSVEKLTEGRRGIITELVVTCVPSRATMKRAFPLLVSWLRGDTLSQEFEARYDV